MEFRKYHGLGNDYLVIDPDDVGRDLTRAEVIRICDRHFGVGADGILWGPLPADEVAGTAFGLRIFNPDGSEAEKSGNGLRIFARHLHDEGLVTNAPFCVLTRGGPVTCRVHPGGGLVDVEMGKVSFDAARIPVRGETGDVIDRRMVIGGEELVYAAATIGNPHCVLPLAEVSPARARRLGPLVETDPRFPNRTNVQLMQILDRANIRIEIWERGAGYTLASGSSSAAAAAVARRMGACDGLITVHMPGGQLAITVGEHWDVGMTGPVTAVARGTIAAEMFAG
jgi:diaminopimelate epimerase